MVCFSSRARLYVFVKCQSYLNDFCDMAEGFLKANEETAWWFWSLEADHLCVCVCAYYRSVAVHGVSNDDAN